MFEIPMDSLDVETRTPYDVDECWTCEGQGDVVVGHDRDGIPLTHSCVWCHGTGMRGAA